MIKKSRALPFTLLELIAAMGVLTILVALVGMVLAGMGRDWSTIDRGAKKLKQMQSIDRIADSAFRNAIPFSWSAGEGASNVLIFRGERDEIFFCYRHAAAGNPLSCLRFLRIYVDRKQLLASYRNTPIIPNELEGERDEVEMEILAEDVQSLTFLYAVRNASSGNVTWVNNWDESENTEDIPIAFQMEIEWTDGHTERWLRRTASNSFNEVYDIRNDEVDRGSTGSTGSAGSAGVPNTSGNRSGNTQRGQSETRLNENQEGSSRGGMPSGAGNSQRGGMSGAGNSQRGGMSGAGNSQRGGMSGSGNSQRGGMPSGSGNLQRGGMSGAGSSQRGGNSSRGGQK